MKRISVRYSLGEVVDHPRELKNDRVREALLDLGIEHSIEIGTFSHLPGHTGLGSSSAFSVALMKGLHAALGKNIDKHGIAEAACRLEIDLVGDPIGKQDQYASAYGGLNTFKFCKNGDIVVKPLNIHEETLYSLEDNLLLFFTGYTRSSSTILKEQDDKSKINDISMICNLNYIKSLGYKSEKAIQNNELDEFASIMDEHWQFKKQRSVHMTNLKIDTWYDIAMDNGALGGKVIGAGGGGLLMFYSNDHQKLRKAMHKEGLKMPEYSELERPRSSVRLEYWPFKPGAAGSNPVGAIYYKIPISFISRDFLR